VLLVHFPISFFIGAFGLMTLHLITRNSCFSQAAYIALISGALVMIPTTITGWSTWKSRYQGIRGKLFARKIWIAYSMLGISIILVIYQTLFPVEFMSVKSMVEHIYYFVGVTLLLVESIVEGYNVGRFKHL